MGNSRIDMIEALVNQLKDDILDKKEFIRQCLKVMDRESGLLDYAEVLALLAEESEYLKDRMVVGILSLLSMLLYEQYPGRRARDMADRCAGLDTVPDIYKKQKGKGWSYAEVFHEQDVGKEIHRSRPMNLRTVEGVGLFVVDEGRKLYAYRELDGCWVLVATVQKAESVFAEEDGRDGFPSQWYTNSGCFPSPVSNLRKLYAQWKYWTDDRQWPRIPVRLEIWFLRRDGFLTNEEEARDRAWGDLDIKLLSRDEVTGVSCMAVDEIPLLYLWTEMIGLLKEADEKSP